MDPEVPPAPAAPAASRPVSPAPGWPRAPRTLEASRGAAWWSEGWRIFAAAPLLWVGLTIVLVLIMIALNFVPFLGTIAQTLLWPVLFGGLMIGCHAMAQGRPLEFRHLFAGFEGGRLGPLLILGAIAFAVGAVIAVAIMILLFGAIGFSGIVGLVSGDPYAAMTSAMAGMGIGTLLAIPIVIGLYGLFLLAYWFAPGLIVLNRAEPVAAMKASWDASWKNIGALFFCGLVFIGLAIVASIPFGLGWLVLVPVSVGAGYASWREVFGE
jgi:hypothetical protein